MGGKGQNAARSRTRTPAPAAKPADALDRLRQTLVDAFAPTPLRTVPWDSRLGGYLHIDELATGIPDGATWAKLTDKFLEFHHDALTYADATGFAALLPAYLLAFARDGDDLDQLPLFLLVSLTRAGREQRFDDKTSALTAGQRAAAREALAFYAGSERHDYMAAEVAAALASFPSGEGAA